MVLRPGSARSPEAIEDWFAFVRRELAYLPSVASAGHPHAAVALALLHIDRLAQRLFWPAESSTKAFVDALLTYGNDERLSLCLPRAFYEGIRRAGKRCAEVAEAHAAFLGGGQRNCFSLPEFREHLATSLSATEISVVEPELWRASAAYAIYFVLRNAAVHGLGPHLGLAFPIRLDGTTVESIDLTSLLRYCSALLDEAESRTWATGQWFGNDYSAWLDPRFAREGA